MREARARSIILREADFLEALRGAPMAERFGGWALAVAQCSELLGQAVIVGRLGEAAHALETFLDDHGARQNRSFATFGELVASVRGLTHLKAVSLHLRSRLSHYQLLIKEESLTGDLDFIDEALNESILALLGQAASEAKKMGLPWEPTRIVSTKEPPAQRRLLPRNLDADHASDDRHHLAQIGSQYLVVLEASKALGLQQAVASDALPSYAAKHTTEERCRWYQSAVHNIQSMYDTYAQGTATEREEPWMAYLRGQASVALHLLEMATGFVHFYERHENDIRHAPARQVIASLVSKDAILRAAINGCLRQAYLCLEEGSSLADRMVAAFLPQGCVHLTLPEGVVLHARPLALIVQVVRRYGMPVELAFDGEVCAGNSLMGLIIVGGSHPRPKLIEAKGDARALADLQQLFASGLGETGPLPDRLAYLSQ